MHRRLLSANARVLVLVASVTIVSVGCLSPPIANQSTRPYDQLVKNTSTSVAAAPTTPSASPPPPSAIAAPSASPTAAPSPSGPSPRDTAYVPGQVIVKFKDSILASPSGEDTIAAANTAVGATVLNRSIVIPGLELVQLPQTITIDEAIARYQQNPAVEYAQPNYQYAL